MPDGRRHAAVVGGSTAIILVERALPSPAPTFACPLLSFGAADVTAASVCARASVRPCVGLATDLASDNALEEACGSQLAQEVLISSLNEKSHPNTPTERLGLPTHQREKWASTTRSQTLMSSEMIAHDCGFFHGLNLNFICYLRFTD